MRMVQEPTEITLASGMNAFLFAFSRICTTLNDHAECVRFHSLLTAGKTYKFRKGDRVGLCPPLWHRDPEIYSEPAAFRPERWQAKPGSTPEEITAASLGKVPQFKGGKQIK